MWHKHLHCGALFLAALAAFSLATGYAPVVQAASDLSAAEQVIDTPEGKAALENAGVSSDKARAMLSTLTPEQRERLNEMVKDITPKARLTAGMLAAGYTMDEAQARLAVLTDAEIAKLASDPEGMTSGGYVATVGVILIALLVFMLVSWYFVAIEDPGVDFIAPETPAQ